MKTYSLLMIAVLICFIYSGCDGSGGGSGDGDDTPDYSDETVSLGSTLTLEGDVDRNTDTDYTTPWASDYNNGINTYDYRLIKESDETIIYATDSGDGSPEEYNNISISYGGTTHLDYLFDISEWTGITSSDDSAQMATITVIVGDNMTTKGDVIYGDLADTSIEYYYYLYSTVETVLDGTYVDGSSDSHIFDSIKVSAGWNRFLVETSDMSSFTYSGGTITDPHWTFIGDDSWF